MLLGRLSIWSSKLETTRLISHLFVNVASLLSDDVELIKEEHAWSCADIVEQTSQTLCGLTQEAAIELFIAYGQQR